MQAQSAVAEAAKLGVSFGNLNLFVKDKTKEFNTATAELKLDTKELNKSRDEAFKSAQAAKKDAENMRIALNEVQQLREKIHNLTTDRVISVSRVTGKLKLFAKTPFIFAVSQDNETVKLLTQIANALETAGWDWKPWESSNDALHMGGNFTGKPFVLQQSIEGISIQVAKADLKILKKPAESLVSALKEELKNISFREISNDDMKSETKIYGVIHIYIGSR